MEASRSTSMLEVAPIRPAADRYDVAMLGGGLAGLTLAIQLKRARPATSIAVLEKREGPAPLAAFKVGESTVPSGAHYFAEVVGMKDHLEQKQNVKCGLRYFLPADGNRDITARVEVGPRDFPEHDNYQIDRGLFENKLAAQARALGVDVLQGCRVREVTFGEDQHTVTFTQLDQETTTQAQWVVDAAGRASLLKRQLGLSTPCGHIINSAWFRLAGGLDLEQWGIENQRFMARMKAPGLRRFSTNHLMGEGYWVWLIPLATGPISIGVCADPRFHPFERINTFPAMLEWLHQHEPQLATAVAERTDEIEDFLRVEDYAYGVTQTYSTDRWSLIGEAAAFADPLFSPGSDFIGYGNTFTTDLITRQLDGHDITDRVEYFNTLYQRIYAFVISKYRDIYAVFGDPWVASGMLGWDVYANHANIVSLMLRNKLTDLEFMHAVDDDLDRQFALGIRMQQLFRDWHQLRIDRAGELDSSPFIHGYRPSSLPALVQEFTDEELQAQLSLETRTSEGLAVAIFHRAAADLPEPPPADRPINPYAVGLDPSRWDADGLFDEPGITLAQASERVPGFDRIWHDPSMPMGSPGGPGGPPARAAG